MQNAAYSNFSSNNLVSSCETNNEPMSHFSKHFQKGREKNICRQFKSAGENWQVPHEKKINVTKEAAF